MIARTNNNNRFFLMRPSFMCWVACVLLIIAGGGINPRHHNSVMAEEKVEWTGNPQDQEGAGPLPQSQNQRDQLLQLEEAIMSSPDPSATLQQVAQANNMEPRALVDLLERNRQDMQMAAGGAAGGGGRAMGGWPKTVARLIWSIGGLLQVAASQNPKSFGFLVTVLLLLLYTAITAPRTGLVLSTGRNAWSSGHTTVWSPPSRYVTKCLESPSLTVQKSISSAVESRSKKDWKILFEETLKVPLKKDGVVVHDLGRKSDFLQSVTAQASLDVKAFMSEEDDDDDEETEEDTESQREAMLELLYDSAATVLSSRRLTEFVGTDDGDANSMRFQSSTDSRQKYSFLAVKGLGNSLWGWFGLVPFKVASHVEGDNETRLTFSTLGKSHFDGRLTITVQLGTTRKTKNKVIVTTNLTIPKKGKKVKSAIASTIVSGITGSIIKSTEATCKQTLARKYQGKNYRKMAKNRATEKRHLKFEQEKKQEEMAQDRKRKWQRQNRDGGRYTPSDRMSKPGGSPNFR
mmetsp:Transcript_19573/g.22012  ORF Transcript_19573/g.22012 Transcript_19573/m.22012 type:complete len:518 (-) Transcript_19573:35-1588(-)